MLPPNIVKLSFLALSIPTPVHDSCSSRTTCRIIFSKFSPMKIQITVWLVSLVAQRDIQLLLLRRTSSRSLPGSHHIHRNFSVFLRNSEEKSNAQPVCTSVHARCFSLSYWENKSGFLFASASHFSLLATRRGKHCYRFSTAFLLT